MKQIITLIAATFFFTSLKAEVKPYQTPLKINVEKTAVKISLQNQGKVVISWSAIPVETTSTIYNIQKRTDNGDFKTIAILMGESFPVYSFRDKLNTESGTIEYRIVISENNEIIGSVSQSLMVL